MIGEIQANLLAKYTTGSGGGRAVASGDAYSDLNDKDCFYNAVVDERPTRDPDLFNRNPPHAATP